MKKILVTWYGITDLKASLGQEATGPILSALQSDEYTDIFILGYTKNLTTQNTISTNKLDIASTKEAHETFISWLDSKIKENNLKTKINFQEVALRHLNDTQNIYNAVIETLTTIQNDSVDKIVTLYLSPGTPVMAFVWAFASLRFTNLHVRLISSSNISKETQAVYLPQEWLEAHGKPLNTASSNNPSEYDVIFHLLGKQRIPILQGIRQFKSKKHILVTSNEFDPSVMKEFIQNANYESIKIDAFDIEDVENSILNKVSKMSTNLMIGFNLTGGTKLMYAGANNACRKINGIAFYFDARNHKVIFLGNYEKQEIKPIESVDIFIKLNSDDLSIKNSGKWENIPNINDKDRKELTLFLWENGSKISSLYKEISQNIEDQKSFRVEKNNVIVELDKNKTAYIKMNNKEFTFKNWRSFAKYIAGGWFEEYVYMKLKPFEEKGIIKDLRIGLEIALPESQKDSNKIFPNQKSYQELDIVFTDGKKLYIVECKAGRVIGTYIEKLGSIVGNYGGVESKGIIAAYFPIQSEVLKKKIKDSKTIEFSGKSFNNQLNTFIHKLK